ncbi:MAG: hypothetical protein ACXW2I_12515 [Burkholderiales bacterium]
MQTRDTVITPGDIQRPLTPARNEALTSGVSWGAVLGGAFAAAAMGLILLSLGTGLGFASASPWQDSGASAKTLGIGAIVWLIVVQVVSASLGGYVAGRLRTKWATVHTDEVTFRDTAHGLIVWAVGVVITAFIVTSAATSVVGKTADVAGSAASSAARGAGSAAAQAVGSSETDGDAYFTDMLLRSEKQTDDASSRAALQRIMANAVRTGQMSPADRTYVAHVISNRAGLSQAEAEKRVDDTFNQAKQTRAKAEEAAREAVDAARKAAAAFAFASFLAMLIGAFCSTYAATVGGRHRDLVND